jgi:hypothetical protein
LNTSDYRFYLNASDFTTRVPRRDGLEWYYFEGSNEKLYYQFIIASCRRVYEGKILCVWEDLRMEVAGGKLETGWASSVYQLDVRYKGAYIEKPDFWKDE